MGCSVPSRRAFAERYAALTAAERAEFLAELKRARGWRTVLGEGVVVTKREATTRRIAVDDPPSDASIDAVVTVNEHLRSIAAERDVEAIDPETLRDEALYGLDRERGETLLETYFGGTDWEATSTVDDDTEPETDNWTADPPARGAIGSSRERADHTTGRPRGGGHTVGGVKPSKGSIPVDDESTASGGVVDRFDGSSLVLAIAISVTLGLFVIFLSVAGGVALPDMLPGDDTDPTGAETRPTAEREDTSATEGETDGDATAEMGDDEPVELTAGPPPGVDVDEGYDAERLAATHAETVTARESFRFRIWVDGPVEDGVADAPSTIDVQVATDNHFLIRDRADVAAERNTTVDIFADGVREYRRYAGADGVRYNSRQITMDPTVTAWSGEYGADLIRTYLNTSERWIEGHSLINRTASQSRESETSTESAPTGEGDHDGVVREDGASDRSVYRLSGAGSPPELEGVATDYEVSAEVTPDGTVRRLHVQYRHEPTGEMVHIRHRYDIDGDEVDVPIWYYLARERTHSRPRPGA